MITDIILFSLFTYLWNTLFHIFYDYYKNVEVVQNLRNLTNVLFFILGHNTLGEEYYRYLAILSFTSYIYDTYIIFSNAKRIKEYFSPYVLHHAICMIGLYYVYIDYITFLIIDQFYILDISNIFLYLTYHYRKVAPEMILMNKLFLLLEFITYSYCRIYLYSRFFINNYDLLMAIGIYEKIMVSIIYAMGCIWTYKLYNQCKKEIIS